MKSLRSLASVATVGLAASSYAQIEDDIPLDYRPIGKNAVSVGLRVGGGVDVTFGGLGSITPAINPAELFAARIGQGSPQRVQMNYDNGQVLLDQQRAGEAPADGQPGSQPGQPYLLRRQRTDGFGLPVVDENGAPVYDIVQQIVGYTPNQTRSWGYQDANQLSSDGQFVRMNAYSTSTLGDASREDASTGSSGGFEITFSRQIGTLGSTRRIQWGFLAGIGLTEINAKTSGQVRARLTTLTDTYRIFGSAPTAPFSGPAFDPDLVSPLTGTTLPSGVETSVPISQEPISRDISESETLINGSWQVKGAYYVLRLGPTIRVPIGERFSVSASAGFAGAYVGTKFRYDETLVAPSGASTNVRENEETETIDRSDFLPGAYADLNVELWLTERTGFYGGVTYENVGNFEQNVGLRRAEVEVGGDVGFRLGVVTRF